MPAIDSCRESGPRVMRISESFKTTMGMEPKFPESGL